MSLLAHLDRAHTVAGPGFNRWLIPPAALSIHLAIGQAYAFSVFNGPLLREGWELTTTGWIFTIAIVFLGLSAAAFGAWLERAGPRQAMLASALCFGGGFLVSALGVATHQIILLYLGYGVLGGIGLGLGYISPVSTLIKWFPDRPGMATGMAIMGFGGGAMIGGPLAVYLMQLFAGPESTGITETFVVMGVGYFLFMLFGAAIVRVPPEAWKPAGFVPPQRSTRLVTNANVTAAEAIRTPQFYLLWAVLFLNVTAGIGVLGQASVMIQERFAGVTAAAAGGFVGLLSLFNMGGRFFWSSLSDYIGRKMTYFVFFLLGAVLYALIPQTGALGSIALFVLGYGVIMSMYGGGFATIPAYLRDLFGTIQVGAIHGRLLTAWSAAGVAGPVLVNYLRKFQIESGVPPAQAYNVTMYLMAGLLVVGALCNLLVTAVHARHHVRTAAAPPLPTSKPQEAVTAAPPARATGPKGDGAPAWSPPDLRRPAAVNVPLLVVSWLWVGIPLAWGVAQTIRQSLALFHS